MRPLPPRAAFALLTSILVSFLAGSSAPTPLYALYQSAWGFSAITTTVIFGVYAVAVLAALLVVGALSDHVGRRPVLVVAAVTQAIAMRVFAGADGVAGLLVARVVQGLATGAAAAAVGAALVDLDRARGAVANAVAPLLGTASGSLGSGLLVAYVPGARELVYDVLFAVYVAQAAGVLLMRETVAPRPGALASLRPRLRVPPAARAAMAQAVPALIASWALVGFYGSLGPALLRRVLDSTSVAAGGLALFVPATSGALMVLALHTRAPRLLLTAGTAGLAGGVALTVVALRVASPALLFASLTVAGAGFGAAFQGAIRTVVPLAAPHERAGVLSVLYVVAYLSMGLPAIAGGARAVYGGGVVAAAQEYGAGVIALAAVALAATLARRPSAIMPASSTVLTTTSSRPS